MPLTKLIHPETGEELELEEAPTRLDQDGIMPFEAVQIVINREGPQRAEAPWYMTPSQINPETNCRREILIKRFMEYAMNPLVQWEALEGTVWDSAFADLEHAEGRKIVKKLVLPLTTGEISPEDGLRRFELIPGMLVRGELDRLDELKDGTLEVYDLKSKRFPRYVKKGSPPADYSRQSAKSWAWQLSAYAHMAEAEFGVKVSQIFVWQIFRGSYMRDYTFKKVPVPLYSREWLATNLESWWGELKGWLERVKQGEPVEQVIQDVELEGLKMFNGKKCDLYCAVNRVCQGLVGERDEFDF